MNLSNQPDINSIKNKFLDICTNKLKYTEQYAKLHFYILEATDNKINEYTKEITGIYYLKNMINIIAITLNPNCSLINLKYFYKNIFIDNDLAN